jgi:hypothetical protein
MPPGRWGSDDTRERREDVGVRYCAARKEIRTHCRTADPTYLELVESTGMAGIHFWVSIPRRVNYYLRNEVRFESIPIVRGIVSERATGKIEHLAGGSLRFAKR